MTALTRCPTCGTNTGHPDELCPYRVRPLPPRCQEWFGSGFTPHICNRMLPCPEHAKPSYARPEEET